MRYMVPLGTSLFTGAHVLIRHTCVGLRRGGRQLRGESPFAPFGAQAAPGPRQLPRRLYCLYKVDWWLMNGCRPSGGCTGAGRGDAPMNPITSRRTPPDAPNIIKRPACPNSLSLAPNDI